MGMVLVFVPLFVIRNSTGWIESRRHTLVSISKKLFPLFHKQVESPSDCCAGYRIAFVGVDWDSKKANVFVP